MNLASLACSAIIFGLQRIKRFAQTQHQRLPPIPVPTKLAVEVNALIPASRKRRAFFAMCGPTMHQISRLNARVCRDLAKGLYVEAAGVASLILRLIVPQLQESSRVDRQNFPATSARLVCVPARLPRQDPDEGIFAIFCNSFEIHWSGSADSDIRLLAASTVYNIGLSFHLHSLVCTTGRQSSDQALKAYRAAGALLRPLPQSCGPPLSGQDARLLALAISNNQGHLLEQRFDAAPARQCLRDLHELVASTAWTNASAQFHETAVLFPSADSIGSMPSPSA